MKTAVEWLVEQFDTTINYTLEEYQLKIQQAKQMEKEQIMKARQDIFHTGNLTAEQYYNETFKSE